MGRWEYLEIVKLCMCFRKKCPASRVNRVKPQLISSFYLTGKEEKVFLIRSGDMMAESGTGLLELVCASLQCLDPSIPQQGFLRF
jgi:hypothetical protein